jgi:hypothetical protein
LAEIKKTLEERVRARAYALWEQDGRPEDRSDECWHRARSEVEAEEAEPGDEGPDILTGKTPKGLLTRIPSIRDQSAPAE